MEASTPDSGQNLAAEEVEVSSDPQWTLKDGPGISQLQAPEFEAAIPLARQSSIYSLTLEEIQNAVCEPGKKFGSLNMDEFLSNIWNVEEGFDASGAAVQAQYPNAGPAPQNRQGFLSLPSQFCGKTVEEVWAEIHRDQHQQVRQQQNHDRQNHKASATRQAAFGEMTLEDFLIKAGVVREGLGIAKPPPLHYGLGGYMMGADTAPGFEPMYGRAAVANGRREELYFYAGDASGEGGIGNGHGGLRLGMARSSVSPISSDGKGGSGGGIDSYGIGMDGRADKSGSGRLKRNAEGTVEKGVERRQRRMIKNRESAARSRARKQAYTVELEVELNHLKEENARLREDEERKMRQMRKQILLESMAKPTHPNKDKRSHSLRRCNSSPS